MLAVCGAQGGAAGPEPRREDPNMLARIRKVVTNEDGASAVEYGLLVAAIAAVVVVIVFALGGVVKQVFTNTCTSIKTGAAVTATCA